MLVIGLTGGIATGKSTVTKLLRQEGIQVIDCDEIAHQVVHKGRWGYKRVLKAFGSGILTSAGDIDRDKLGQLVFNDHNARRKLNSATHTPVALELLRQVLLQWMSLTSLVVSRLISRDKCSQQQAEAKVAAQMPLRSKEVKAQTVINNSKDFEHIKTQVQKLVVSLHSYTWLGIATSPPVLMGFIWLALKMVVVNL